MDRRQAGVACPGAVVPLVLQVVEEAADQAGVELPEVQPERRGSGVVLGVGEQQAEGVAVGGDGVLAGVFLGDHPIGEEALQDRGEAGHRWSPGSGQSVARRCRMVLVVIPAASARSWEDAEMYQ